MDKERSISATEPEWKFRKEHLQIFYSLEPIYAPPNAVLKIIQKFSKPGKKTLVMVGEPRAGKSTLLTQAREVIMTYSSYLFGGKKTTDLAMHWYDYSRSEVLQSEKWNWGAEDFSQIAGSGRENEFRADLNDQIIKDVQVLSAIGKLTNYRSSVQGLELPLIGLQDYGRSALRHLIDTEILGNYLVVGVVPDKSLQERANSITESVLQIAPEEVQEFLRGEGIYIETANKNLDNFAIGRRVKAIFRKVAPRERVLAINAEVEKAASMITKPQLKEIRSLIPPQYYDNPSVLHMMDILLESFPEGVGIPRKNFMVFVNKLKANAKTKLNLDFLERSTQTVKNIANG